MIPANPLFPCKWEYYLLSHCHHELRSMDDQTMFMVWPWNIVIYCMIYNVLLNHCWYNYNNIFAWSNLKQSLSFESEKRYTCTLFNTLVAGNLWYGEWPKHHYLHPDSKLHGANKGPVWGRQDPCLSHVGPMNIAIWAVLTNIHFTRLFLYNIITFIAIATSDLFWKLTFSYLTLGLMYLILPHTFVFYVIMYHICFGLTIPIQM